MKQLDMITLLVLIVAGLDWGIAGIFSFDIITWIFSFSFFIIRIIWIVVGAAAVYQLIPFVRMMSGGTEGRM
jgi:uncharacterized protein